MTSHITGKTMRQLTIVLGIIGTVAGIWSYFATWLNILGVLKPFAAWAIGAAVALLTHFYAPQLSDAVVAMVTGGFAFTALTLVTGSTTTPTDYEAEEPALSGEAV
jgi:cytosine permease